MQPEIKLDPAAMPPLPTPEQRLERTAALARLAGSKDGKVMLGMLREELLAALLGTAGAHDDRAANRLAGRAESYISLIQRLESAEAERERLERRRE